MAVGDLKEEDGRRLYETPKGVMPSVTTILGKTKDLRHIKRWQRRVGREKAEQIKQNASKRGNHLHKLVENWFNDFEEGEGVWWESIWPVLERISEPKMIEQFVWHSRGFAGTADFVGCFDGVLSLIDWKTAGAPKREEWIADYKLQGVAYAAAVRERYPELKDKLKRVVIVIAQTNEKEVQKAADEGVVLSLAARPAQVFVVDGSLALGTQFRQFQKRLAQYEAMAA